MNYLGIVVIIVGILNLLYGFFCKNRLSIYLKRENLEIIMPDAFFELQFKSYIVSALVFVSLGGYIIFYNATNILILISPIIFHITNLMILTIGKKCGYIRGVN